MEQNELYLRRIGSVLGVIQGIAYTIMALLCIIYYSVSPLELKEETHMDTVNILLYTIFLGSNGRVFIGQTMTSHVFAGFVWVYFLLHLVWTALSVIIWKKRSFYIRWCCVTFLISTWDLITVIIVGTDYNKCLNFAKLYYWNIEQIENEGRCINGILPVLVIAARGFVLWIINVIFATTLFVWNMWPERFMGKTIEEPVAAEPTIHTVDTPASQKNTGPQNSFLCEITAARERLQKPGHPVSIPEPDYY